jgi:hypothetical protein
VDVTSLRELNDELADLVLAQLIADTAPEGFAKWRLERAMLVAGAATESNVNVKIGMAIARLRKEWGADVLVYNRPSQRYRASLTRGEALAWLIDLLRQISARLGNCHHYLSAATTKYAAELTTPSVARQLAWLTDSLDRAKVDADRAAELMVDLLGA